MRLSTRQGNTRTKRNLLSCSQPLSLLLVMSMCCPVFFLTYVHKIGLHESTASESVFSLPVLRQGGSFVDTLIPNRSLSTLSTANATASSDFQYPTHASTNNQSQQGTPSQRPHFVLHIGPPKTGTTTIQCGLSKHAKLLAELDRLYFVGASCADTGFGMEEEVLENGELTLLGGIVFELLDKSGKEKKNYNYLKRRINHHYARGNSMVFSIEGMGRRLPDRDEIWEQVKGLFDDSPYSVEIVIYYRHYYDWLYSLYYQEYHSWVDTDYWKNPHPSFHEFLEKHMLFYNKTKRLGDSRDRHSLGQHLSIRAYERWTRHFVNVKFVSMHQEGDILTNLLCNGTVSAPNTCRYLQLHPEHGDSEVKRKAQDNFDADRTAEAALTQGLIPDTVDKEDATWEVQKVFEQTVPSIPEKYATCLPPYLLNQFLNVSLAFERRYMELDNPLVSEEAIDQAMETHRAKFQKAVASGKYCQINPIQALSEPPVIEALEMLRKGNVTVSVTEH